MTEKKLKPCPDCLYNDGYVDCDDCDGTGDDGNGECWTCKGRGTMTCGTCDGTEVVVVEVDGE